MIEKATHRTEYLPRLGALSGILSVTTLLMILFFINYMLTQSMWYAIFCLTSFMVFGFFCYPVLINQKVYLENGNITFKYRLGKPITVPVADSLYEIVARRNEVISFRFRIGRRRRAQVSPKSYHNGDRLKEHLNALRKKEKIKVRFVKR